MHFEKIKDLKTQFLISAPLLFLVGGLLHSCYAWSGNLPAVGLIAPVNESIFEHLKLCLLPVFLWWTLMYLLYHRRCSLFAAEWFFAALGAVVTAIAWVLFLYYTYTGIFGAHKLPADLLVFGAALVLGQWQGVRLYRRACPVPLVLSLMAAALLWGLFALWTFCPPDLPLFIDSTTGLAGLPVPV